MRDFLKHTFATVVGILIFMGLSLGGLITLIILASSKDSGPEVENKSVLVFDLSTRISDAKRDSSTSQALQEALAGDEETSLTLRSVLNAIDEASRDSRIVGLYLTGNSDSGSGSTGLATLKEVREALQRFRATGKKILAYDVNWREREYYLGSVADTVILNPIGSMELNGFSSEPLFLAGALQKYGIGIQVTRVGKYKSAVEPLLLNKLSPANREQTQTLLGDLWREFLVTTSKDRKRTPQELQAIADSQGVLLADEALKRGMVDRVAYLDEVIGDLKKLTDSKDDEKSFRQINLATYVRVASEAVADKQNSKNKVAVVYAEGDIVNGQGGIGEVGGDRLARQLRRLRQDEDVKAVVLRVNSPGGSVTASEVIQREVVLTRKVKPVVVSMGSVAASGGYWISTYSDRIFAEANTITGSIGVFGVQPNFQAIANNNGLTWDVVKTARFADSQTVSRPKTPQELAILQKSVDRIYDQFLSKVAESRKLDKSKVAEIAQGRVWSGRRAKELGLVDELGGLDAAVQDAAKRAKLGDDWEVEEYPKSRSFEERLFGRLTGDQSRESSARTRDPLITEFRKLQTELGTLRSLNDPLGVYARLPFNIQVE